MPVINTGLRHTLAQVMKGITVEFWANPTVNSDGTIDLEDDGTLDPVAHPNALNLGFTQDGADLGRNPTFEDLPVDQAIEPVETSYTGQDVHMKTSILQIRDYVAVALLSPGVKKVSGTGFVGVSDSKDRSITPITIAAISPTQNDPTKFMVMIIYAGYNVAPFSAKFAKQYHKCPIDIKAQDAGRSDGKTWFVYETTA